MPSVKSELSVITKAKELCSYILTVTDKSPKRFRFTLTGRLQNGALNILEYIYRANEVLVEKGNAQAMRERADYQKKALSECRLLSYLSQLAIEQKCILPGQYEQISRRIYDVQNLLGAWEKSDRKRFGDCM